MPCHAARQDAPPWRVGVVGAAELLQQSRATLEVGPLARARRLPRVHAPRRAPSRGSSTRVRRPRTAGPAPTTSCRASSRTSSRASRPCAGTAWSARAAGTATACRSRSPSSSSSASPRRPRSRPTASPSSTQRCRESVFEYLEDWNALTERIGFWLDLDDAYRTLDPDLHRVGLVGAEADPRARPALRGPQGRPLLPALRHRAVLARGRAGLPGRRRPERVRPLPGRRGRRPAAGRRRAARRGRRRRGRSSPTPRSRSTPS